MFKPDTSAAIDSGCLTSDFQPISEMYHQNEAQILNVKEGWISNLSGVPHLTVAIVEKYMKEARCSRQINSGWNVKEENFIKNIQVNLLNSDSRTVLVRGICFPSMKGGSYNVYARLSKDSSTITEAYCTCIAGLSESCSHVAGLLFTIAEAIEKEALTCVASCTEVLCKWIEPSCLKRPANPKPLSAIAFQKCLINKPKKSPTKRKLFIPSSINITSAKIETFNEELQLAKPDIMYLRYATFQNNLDNYETQVPKITNLDLLSEDFSQKVDKYISNIKPISETEKKLIIAETIGQASNPNWFNQRVGKLTASIFGKIRNCWKPEYIVKEVLYPTSKARSENLQYGRDNEANAVTAYIDFMKMFDKNVVVQETGLHLSCEHPYIGASPDRLVKDETGEGILEVKCPISKQNMTGESACLDSKFFCKLENGQMQLKRSHQYYMQVQGQLALAECEWCDFVIWTNNGNDSITVERIYFDRTLWETELLPSLLHFYRYAVVPEILTTRIRQTGKLYENTSDYTSFKKSRNVVTKSTKRKL